MSHYHELSSLPSLQVLEVVCDRNAQRLRSPQEVLHDGVCVVSKGDLDGSVESMEVSVVAGSLVGLMLLHERKKLFRRPTLCLEVIVIGGGSTGVHLGRRKTISAGFAEEHQELGLTMKLMELPPPRTWAVGTIALRPSSHCDGRE